MTHRSRWTACAMHDHRSCRARRPPAGVFEQQHAARVDGPTTIDSRRSPRASRTRSTRRCASIRSKCSARTTATTASRTRRCSPLAKVNTATAAGLDYGHRPLAQQFALGVRQLELDVWADPKGGKCFHSVAARRRSGSRTGSGDHGQARVQGDARGVHRHPLHVPHVRAVPAGGEDVVGRAPGPCADDDRRRDEGRRS